MNARHIALRIAVAGKRMLVHTPLRRLATSRAARVVRRWLLHRRLSGTSIMAVAGLELEVPTSFAVHNAAGFEPLSLQWILAASRPGQRFIDVGAHAGVVSCVVGRALQPGGSVIAIEPDPRNRDLLTRNVARIGLVDAVTVVDAAVAARPGRARLALHDNSDASRLIRGWSRRTMEVTVVTLEEICAAHGQPDLIKVDVEGGELDVLAGIPSLLRRKPRMLVELNPGALRRSGRTAHELVRTLHELGFRLSVLDDVYGRVTDVETVLAELDSLPQDWYANLACDG